MRSLSDTCPSVQLLGKNVAPAPQTTVSLSELSAGGLPLLLRLGSGVSCLTCGRLLVWWRGGGGEPKTAPRGPACYSERRRAIFRTVPCRAGPLSASVPFGVYAAALLTTALIHQSQLRKLAAGVPGLHFIPLLSPPPPSFVIHQPTRAERNGVAIVNIPGGLSAWRAPPLVRHAERPVSPVTSLR